LVLSAIALGGCAIGAGAVEGEAAGTPDEDWEGHGDHDAVADDLAPADAAGAGPFDFAEATAFGVDAADDDAEDSAYEGDEHGDDDGCAGAGPEAHDEQRARDDFGPGDDVGQGDDEVALGVRVQHLEAHDAVGETLGLAEFHDAREDEKATQQQPAQQREPARRGWRLVLHGGGLLVEGFAGGGR
jgi:hypothetical protein